MKQQCSNREPHEEHEWPGIPFLEKGFLHCLGVGAKTTEGNRTVQYLVITGDKLIVHKSHGTRTVGVNDVHANVHDLVEADVIIAVDILPGEEIQLDLIRERVSVLPEFPSRG